MEMIQAIPQQTTFVETIMREKAQWLHEIGSDQWSDLLSGHDKHGMKQAIERGEVYLFHVQGEIVGMVALWKQPTAWDRDLWGERADNQNVLYIHRLIVRNEFSGRGLGEQMLNEIKQFAQASEADLRLDCLAMNPTLLAFYERNHFVKTGQKQINQGTFFQLFEHKQPKSEL